MVPLVPAPPCTHGSTTLFTGHRGPTRWRRGRPLCDCCLCTSTAFKRLHSYMEGPVDGTTGARPLGAIGALGVMADLARSAQQSVPPAHVICAHPTPSPLPRCRTLPLHSMRSHPVNRHCAPHRSPPCLSPSLSPRSRVSSRKAILLPSCTSPPVASIVPLAPPLPSPGNAYPSSLCPVPPFAALPSFFVPPHCPSSAPLRLALTFSHSTVHALCVPRNPLTPLGPPPLLPCPAHPAW